MMRGRREVEPVLLKFGVAVILSLGGILYTILRNKRIKSSKRPPLLPPSAGGKQGEHTDKDRSLQTTHHSCLDKQTTPHPRTSGSMPSEKHEDLSIAGDDTDICGPSTSGRFEGKDDGLLLPEFNDLVRDYNLDTPKCGVSLIKDVVEVQYEVASPPEEYKSVERVEHEQEIRSLKDIVNALKERERTLEIKLLEYYGLKEQETAVRELQNRIKINNMESKLFTLKIESLMADKRRLEAQVSENAKVVSELEAAKIKIKQLKKKLRSEAEHSKEQICALQERVMKLHDQEKAALDTLHSHEKKANENESDVHIKLQKIQELQLEAEKLRMSNKSLRTENSDLSQRLEYVQILANSVLDDEVTEALKAESEQLRKQNEEMAKEIEQLQADRCTDAEELVYLRWVNACLRYELRNYQPETGKPIARDLSKSLSPKSEEKAKQLILEYAHKEGPGDKSSHSNDFDYDWSSSQASYLTDSGEPDDTSVDNSSATNNKSQTHKKRVFSKLMRLIRGKDKLKVPSINEDNVRKYHGDSPVVDTGHDCFNSRSRSSSQSIRDSDASLGGLRRTDSTPASLNSLPPENFHKSDLAKYADVLKETRSIPSFRRRSASYSSYL